MTLTCPCCHAKYPLESAMDSEAAGELQVLLAQAGPLARPLVAYLGLFRSKSRALAFERALRLAREVLDLGDHHQLAAALVETVEALRRKREAGDVRPLKDHNYLKSVLKSVAASPLPSAECGQNIPQNIPSAPKGKRRQAIDVLNTWAGQHWRRREIADGLAALVVLGLDGSPAADTIEYTAGVWETVLEGRRIEVEQVDAGRIAKAFKTLLKRPLNKWPEPSALFEHLPRRPERKSLDEPQDNREEQRAAGREAIQKIKEGL